jgi:nucleotidyltransferase substrate binding protein (TIGR01987 family)
MKTATPINCSKCLQDFQASLEELKELMSQYRDNVSDIKIQRKIIRSFELTHELALHTIGVYFKGHGRKPFSGSREATVEAFNENLIDDGAAWLDMIICRIKINPLYPGDHEATLVNQIALKYMSLFDVFSTKMVAILD